MKGFMKLYLYSKKNEIEIEVTPDIFFKHMESYWNINIEYENGDIWFTGDANYEDNAEIGRITLFEEDQKHEKHEKETDI